MDARRILRLVRVKRYELENGGANSMNRARILIALCSVLVFGLLPAACNKTAPVQRNAGGPVVKDTGVATQVRDSAGVVEIFKDTVPANVFAAKGRTFKLQTPWQRDSLHATLRKERELWQARKPRDYRFLLRVACFCPGMLGWLLIEVRNGRPLRATDSAGRPVALTDWNTFSIDGLYDNLERYDNNREVQIAFDPRWHSPAYVRSIALPGPDTWSIIEVRGLRPI